MYGKRFDYKDPTFQAMISRDLENIYHTGSPAIQVLQSFRSVLETVFRS